MPKDRLASGLKRRHKYQCSVCKKKSSSTNPAIWKNKICLDCRIRNIMKLMREMKKAKAVNR